MGVCWRCDRQLLERSHWAILPLTASHSLLRTQHSPFYLCGVEGVWLSTYLLSKRATCQPRHGSLAGPISTKYWSSFGQSLSCAQNVVHRCVER